MSTAAHTSASASTDLKVTFKRSRDGTTITSANPSTSAVATTATLAAHNISNIPSKQFNQKNRPRTLLDYLSTLSTAVLNSFYNDPFTSLTVFRSLSSLAKLYIMRLLYCPENLGIEKDVIEHWTRDDIHSKQLQYQALQRLKELRILMLTERPIDSTTEFSSTSISIPTSSSSSSTKPQKYFLNKVFQSQLRSILQDVNVLSSSWLTKASQNLSSNITDPSPPTLEELDAYAFARWDAVLHYLIGVQTNTVNHSNNLSNHNHRHALLNGSKVNTSFLTNFLIRLGLMEELAVNNRSDVVISSVGFSFLFKDIHTQVWEMLLAYLDTLSGSINESLSFLLRFASTPLGEALPTSTISLTPAQQQLLDDFKEIGLIYVNKVITHGTVFFYYPTKLAMFISSTSHTSMTISPSSAAPSVSAMPSEGFIIVETTFKVYAFTHSAFALALVSLFTRLDYALPDVVVGTLTKDSIRRALKHRISSKEIISYLQQYAHPHMHKGKTTGGPILPENVVDQIRLWEAERNRFEITPETCLLQEFASDEEFLNIQLELERHSLCLFSNKQKKMIVTTNDGISILRAYRQRKNAEKSPTETDPNS